MSKIQKALRNIREGKSRSKAGPSSSTNHDMGNDRTIVLPVSDRPKISIDWQGLRDGGLIPDAEGSDQLARQIRDIKRPLIGNAFGKRAAQVEDGNLIMVSSSFSGEGKTFLTFNLACSMAQERDHTVLLVDADVAKPHTSESFGLQNEKGLLDILEHPDVPVESAIFDTDFPGLSVLAAGTPRAHSTELLASSRMERLVNQLASADSNRIILFDSPPLLQTSESRVLAGFVGQIVMVVGAEKTAKGAVAEALELLGEDKAVNLILNMATIDPNGLRGAYGSANYHPSYYGGGMYDAESAAVEQVGGEK